MRIGLTAAAVVLGLFAWLAFAQPIDPCTVEPYRRLPICRGHSSTSPVVLNGSTVAFVSQCTDSPLYTESPRQGIGLTRSSSAYCIKSDGTAVLMATNKPRIERMGLLMEVSASNLADVRSDAGTGAARDLTDPAWAVSNMTCVLTATGADGTVNAATTCTASANNGNVKAALTVANSKRATSFFIKRRTGTGTVLVTRDNFSHTTDVSSGLSSTTWKRIWSDCGGRGSDTNFSLIDNCVAASNLASTSANPTIGIKLGTSGDAVDIDFAQDEPYFNTSPMSGFDRAKDVTVVTLDGGLPSTGEISVDWASERTAGIDPSGNLPILVTTGTLGAGKSAIEPWLSTDTAVIGTYIRDASGLSQLGPGDGFSLHTGRGRNQRVMWSGGNAALFADGVGAAHITDASGHTPTDHSGPYRVGTANSDDTTLSGWLTRVRWTSGSVSDFPGSSLTAYIIGDSITEAANNLVTEGYYPEQVLQAGIGGRRLDKYVINGGTSGNTIQQCDTNARGVIDEAVAYGANGTHRVIVFQCGTNSEGDGAAAVWAVISTFVLDSIDAGVRVLPSTITPYTARDPFIQGVNTRMRNVFNDAGIKWCDTYHDMEYPPDSGILNPAYDFGDNIHVKAAGAAAEATAWYNCGHDAGYW